MKRAALVARLRQQVPALLVASACGWLALFSGPRLSENAALCLGGAADRAADAPWTALFPDPLSSVAFVVPWSVMLLAMMPPLLSEPLIALWQSCLTRRRWCAVLLFGLGYAGVWLGAAPAMLGAAALLTALASALGVPAMALAMPLALLWQATPAKQVALNRCHRRDPIAAFGRRADTDALLAGAVHGLWCVGACWALMLVPLTAGDLHLPGMAAVMLVMLVERARRPCPAVWGAALPPLPGLLIDQHGREAITPARRERTAP